MQERIALSPSDLRVFKAPIEHVPESLEDALVHTFVRDVNSHLRTERETEFMGIAESEPEPEVAEHYFYHFAPGLVSSLIVDGVVEHFRASEWQHTEIVGAVLVIARTKYVPTKGSAPPGAVVRGRSPSHAADSRVPLPIAG